MKKLISLLISTILMLQMLALPVFAEETPDAEYWSTIESFGIVSEDTNKNGTFTIADMCKMVYRLMNLTNEAEPEATHQIYTDVDRWHWAAGYVEWLYNNSIYTGDGSGTLEPERAVMLSDVCSLTLNLLGYTRLMEELKDNIESIKKAAQVGLLKSNVNRTEHEVTYDEFASICFEMLFTDVVELVYSTKVAYTTGGEFINEVLELEYDNGILLGAGGYSLSKAYCDTDEVIIDGNPLKASQNAQYSDYLGYRVKYYYSQEEEFLVSAIPFKNEEIVINSSDIIRYQNNTYTFKENGRRKVEKCEDVLLLYNGKITSNRNAFKPAYGQVRLIDNDGDGKFECVISENAVDIILEKVVDGIIYGKKADSVGRKYAIDTTKLDMLVIRGEESFDELSENTIISAVISEDGKYGTFYISKKKTTGVLEGFEEGKIIIDGVEYPEYSNLYNPDSITASGSSIEAGIDVYGGIAFIAATGESGYKFGYLINIKEDTSEEKLILKLLTADGGVLKIYTSDKLYIDGIRMKTLDDARTKLRVDEIIRYRTANGEIRHIDIAIRKSDSSNVRINSQLNSLTMIAEGADRLYKSGPQIFKYIGTPPKKVPPEEPPKKVPPEVHSEFALNDDTLVFFVDMTDNSRGVVHYYVGDRTSLRDDLNPEVQEVQAYVTGSDALFAEVVVVKHTTIVPPATKFTIVDKVSLTVNDDNEVVGRIRGLNNGKEVDVIVPNQSLLEDIDKGSIIRYQTNKDGEVKSLSNIYGRNGTGVVNTRETHSWISGTSGNSDVNATVRAVVGYVQEKSGTFVRFKFKDNKSTDELFNLKNCNFYVYDESEKPHLRNGTIDDLYDYAHYGSECDEVIICTRAANVSDVFLIRR